MIVGLSVATMHGNVQNFVWLAWQQFKSRTLIRWGLFVMTTQRNTELLVHDAVVCMGSHNSLWILNNDFNAMFTESMCHGGVCCRQNSPCSKLPHGGRWGSSMTSVIITSCCMGNWGGGGGGGGRGGGGHQCLPKTLMLGPYYDLRQLVFSISLCMCCIVNRTQSRLACWICMCVDPIRTADWQLWWKI